MPELDDQLQVELGNPWAAMDDRGRAALEIQRRANEQAQRVAEEQAQRLVEEQAQRLAEEQAQRLVEEQAQRLAEEQARRWAEEQAQRLAEEQARRLAEEQAQRLAEQARIRADEERANGLVSMAAAACGFPPLPAYQAARRLEAWRLEQNQMLAARCRQLEDTKIRQRLLLKGKSAVQVAEEATAAAARAARFGADVDASALAAASQDVAGLGLPDHHRSDVERAVADALRHYQDAVEEASRADNAVLAQGRILPSVVEAEEALERATRELARVTELDDILGLAYEFVSTVHEQAVADVGPSLAALMREWLPQLTDHRYTDATVDPMTLEVRVRAEQGHWCDPRELSFATAEQIYLLLRIALICYVTRDGETCPLLLDDVIVHADAARTEQMLTLLQHLARERQVVLFTQQDVVADWARGHLPADGYVPLTRRPAA